MGGGRTAKDELGRLEAMTEEGPTSKEIAVKLGKGRKQVD
jgi:hypothetical protein